MNLDVKKLLVGGGQRQLWSFFSVLRLKLEMDQDPSLTIIHIHSPKLYISEKNMNSKKPDKYKIEKYFIKTILNSCSFQRYAILVLVLQGVS